MIETTAPSAETPSMMPIVPRTTCMSPFEIPLSTIAWMRRGTAKSVRMETVSAVNAMTALRRYGFRYVRIFRRLRMCSPFRHHQSEQQEIGCRACRLLPFPWLLGAPRAAQQRHHGRHERPDESLGDALGVHLPEPSGFDAAFHETRDTIYCLPHVTRLVLSEQLIIRPRLLDDRAYPWLLGNRCQKGPLDEPDESIAVHQIFGFRPETVYG